MNMTLDTMKWWQKNVFYQIYPRSFADGNGDGIGDFKGIIERMDYLQDLGIEAIWLSPHYPSPLIDCGYDISDYCAVAPEYGTIDDFLTFLNASHQRGIRVILDLVLNHTSDKHPWFQESRSGHGNPYRDWYLWLNGVDGGPPNNWLSPFGGSAWEYDPFSDQFYYHYFFKQQPDLNWKNPDVKRAMFAVIRFWLDLGVDGFRLDAVGTIYEHPEYLNHEVPYSQGELLRLGRVAKTPKDQDEINRLWKELFKYQVEQPEVHNLMKEIRAVVDEYNDRVLVGEDDLVQYYGSNNDELHMVFNFPLMRTERLTAEWVRANQAERSAALNKISSQAWPCNTLGNHDNPRVFSRYGDGKNDAELARISLALMLTLRGTPFLYNGEEIGMSDLELTEIDQFRDHIGIWLYKIETSEFGTDPTRALQYAALHSRDKNRTPFQWSSMENAGFSPPGVKTWLPVHPKYRDGVNVADQIDDPLSLLSFYRKFLGLRKRMPALVGGDYIQLLPHDENCLAFLRKIAGQTCLVAINLSCEEHYIDLSEVGKPKEIVLSTNQQISIAIDMAEIKLKPYEILVIELQEKN